MKSGSFFREDNKPLTARELKAILNSIPDALIDQPVTMSSDEEGNDMLKLQAVDLDKNGLITLWPARD